MIREEYLLKILHATHISEKASDTIEKNNTVVFKIAKDVKKAEIKAAIRKLFEVEVEAVNTLLVKGKIKRSGKHIGVRNNWKKAYVTIKDGQDLSFISNAE